ncbi:MAG: hypothetical protein CO108_18260 [Deltaproteobacteria bacterium CG_4_9_14_3_um_filter_63_12]|nr:MAG: hypothetical protein CO108_18260 [Deltaproteobacteria bacterium CG_4_9_14_3_um_filter_63_12]
MKAKTTSFLYALVVGVLVVGCVEEKTTDEATTTLVFEVNARTKLPRMGGLEECVESGTPVDGSVWFDSTDAIIIGRLASLEAATDLLQSSGSEGEGGLKQSCVGSIDPAVDAVFEVVHAFKGSVGQTVRVRLGQGLLDAYGIIAFLDNGQLELLFSPFVVGQLYGLPLHYSTEYELWSPLLDPLFGLEMNGSSIFFMESGRCHPQPPLIASVQAIGAAQGHNTSVEEVERRRRSLYSVITAAGPKEEDLLFGWCFE